MYKIFQMKQNNKHTFLHKHNQLKNDDFFILKKNKIFIFKLGPLGSAIVIDKCFFQFFFLDSNDECLKNQTNNR